MCQFVPTLPRLIAEVGVPLFISQISRWPVTLFSQTRSAFPSPLKSPAPTTCQPPLRVGSSILYWAIPSAIIQIRCCPLFLSQTRSDWPLPRKSPTAAICQLGSIVPRLVLPIGTPFCIDQISRLPVTDCSHIRSAKPSLLKSLETPLPCGITARSSRPNTATESVVATNTLPLHIVGVINLLASPN